jgi:hypothetical protein
VVRRTLDDTVTLSGTLSRLEQRTVTSDGTGQISDISVTNGQTVQPGQSIIGINGRESVAEPGSFPFFRSLSVGDTGSDVAQLDQILTAQGFDPGPVSTTFTTQTQFALAQWQAAHNYPGVGPTKAATVDVSLEPGTAYKVGSQSSIGMQIDATPTSAGASATLQSVATHRTRPDVQLVSAVLEANPAGPQLTIQAVNQVTTKGASAVFVVYASSATSSAIEFNVTEGGNAPSNEVLAPLGPLTLAAGATSVEIQVPTRENGLVEPPATLTLGLSSGAGYTVGSPSVADTVIDSSDVPKISLSGGGSVQPGQSATITVSADQAPVQPTQILLAAAGTAQPGTDYAALTPAVTLEPGQTTAKVKVQTLAGPGIKPDRYLLVSVQQSSSYTIGPIPTATVTILGQTGSAALPVVTLQAQSNYITKGEPFPVVIGLNEPMSTPLTLNLDYGGTAREGTDFILPGGPVTVPAGQTSLAVQIPTVTDNVTEPDTTLSVALGVSSSYTVGSPSSASTVITSSVLPVLTITAGTSSVAEGASTSFTITADQPAVTAISVDFQVSGTAQPGQDYQPLTGTALLPAGQRSVTVPLLTINNDVAFYPTDMIVGNWPTRIGQVFVKAGDNIAQPGANLFSLTDTNFTVTLTATASDRTQLEVGQSCTVELQDGSAEATGVISQLDANVTVDPTTKAETYSGKIAVGNLGAADGATVTIKVIDQAADNVLSVPIAAVEQNGLGQDVVRVLDLAHRGRVIDVPVQTGLSDGTYTEIVKGLDEGEVVIVEEDATSG